MGASREPRLSGWGRIFRPGREVCSEDLDSLSLQVPLFRGLGRSYGDASLPATCVPAVGSTVLADRLLAFDPQTGVLRAEAGLSLSQLQRVFLPRGWSSPVLTGTQFVTLGGMVAADVHGKNHHRAGSFGAHVQSLRMRVADGRVLEVSRTREPDLFRATVGGMGLTGHVLEVTVALEKIPSPWIWCESRRVRGFDELVEGLVAAGEKWPYTVAWVDALAGDLGRGILSCGRWAEADEAPAEPPRPTSQIVVPVVLPSWTINPASSRLFNRLYYHRHLARRRAGIVHPESFFFPLDGVGAWNRVYGPRGMTQYQCVVPTADDPRRPRRFLEELRRLGGLPTLVVVKDCGAQGEGLLSFPRPGVSLAVDMAVGRKTQELVDALNEWLIAEGGRVYLAKDQFTRPAHYRAMEPRLEAWREVRRRWDPGHKLRSAQSARLLEESP